MNSRLCTPGPALHPHCASMLPALCWQPPAAWSRHLLLTQVSLASDFMWNLNSREASASFGYDYILRQCRLRGRIDTGALCGLAAALAQLRGWPCGRADELAAAAGCQRLCGTWFPPPHPRARSTLLFLAATCHPCRRQDCGVPGGAVERGRQLCAVCGRCAAQLLSHAKL